MPASSPCSTCLHWDPFPQGAYGRCRINAPTVVTTIQSAPDQSSAHWPLTAATDWCGQWSVAASMRAAYHVAFPDLARSPRSDTDRVAAGRNEVEAGGA
jgi:hypothetical protein